MSDYNVVGALCNAHFILNWNHCLGVSDLCFDRHEFERSDFDVERFVTRARQNGATIKRLSRDLRMYLRFVQVIVHVLILSNEISCAERNGAIDQR